MQTIVEIVEKGLIQQHSISKILNIVKQENPHTKINEAAIKFYLYKLVKNKKISKQIAIEKYNCGIRKLCVIEKSKKKYRKINTEKQNRYRK